MPRVWRFNCYVSARGVNEIRSWYDDGTPRMRATFVSRLQLLSQFQSHEWKLPYFRWLHGEGAGLGEVRINTDKVQHRPIGFRSSNIFTLLCCPVEKGGKLPKSAFSIAKQRQIEVENDDERSCPIWLSLD
jgi:hypothetical protein